MLYYIEIWKKVFKNFKAWWKTKSEYIKYSSTYKAYYYVFVYDILYRYEKIAHPHLTIRLLVKLKLLA